MAKKTKIKEPVDGIYKIDKAKNDVAFTKLTRVYTVLGKQDELDDDQPVLIGADADKREVAYAKREVNHGNTKYFIKVNEIGGLFDPFSLAPLTQTLQGKLLKNEGSGFVSVNKSCFDQYLIFLKTCNKLHYKFAERERI